MQTLRHRSHIRQIPGIEIRLIRDFRIKRNDIIIFINKLYRHQTTMYNIKFMDKYHNVVYMFIIHTFQELMQYIDTILWQIAFDTEPFVSFQYDIPGFPPIINKHYDMINPAVYQTFLSAMHIYARYREL